MTNKILMFAVLFSFLAKSATAAWKCEAEITDRGGKVFQKQTSVLNHLEELDLFFDADPDVTGAEVGLFVNNSRLHFFGSSFYVNDSLPKVEAAHCFMKGWVTLRCTPSGGFYEIH